MDGYQCSTCHKTFGRQEHLKRHEQSHKAAQFHCSVCSKAFRRRDALKKHQQNHLTNDASLRQRGARACSSCATSKSRCTGDVPCARCLSKQLQCVYPTKKVCLANDSLVRVQSRDQHVSDNASSPPTQPSSVGEEALGFAAHHPDAEPPRHDLDSNIEPYTHPISQPNIAQAYHPQELYCDQADTFYPSLGQHTAVEATDLAINAMSTINWLQMDAMSFNSDDLHNMFPYPSNDFSIPASIGFANLTKENSISLSADPPFSNIFDQQRPLPQLVNDTSNQQSVPIVLDSRISTEDVIGHQLLSPMTNSSVPTDEATVASGEYYVDGDVGRLPRPKRQSIPIRSMRSLKLVEEVDFSLRFPYPILTNSDPRLILSDEVHKQLCNLHVQLCLETTIFKAFKLSDFPSKANLEGLLYQYFSQFDQTMPFLHFPTFRAESTHGALLLSMMALGSAYLDCGNTETFSLSMHEFVRRYLILRRERRYWPPEGPRTLAQIQLLHAIGAGFTLYEPLHISASKSLYSATKFCHNEWISQVYGEESRPRNVSPDWTIWLKNEESLRTGFCIWIFDCMWAFHFHKTPHLSLDLAAAMNLPCAEKLWSANDVVAWTRLTGPDASAFDTPTFLEALQNLYIDKRLLSKLGEFSRILLIYGLIRRTSEVKASVTQSLSTFEPSAQKQTSSNILPKAPSWPPSVPLFNKWRNSACDCLDILHWDANATIGAASGIEHPTVLHLHLARVLLLGPMREIVLFAHYLIRPSKDVMHSNNNNGSTIFPSTSSAAEAEAHCRLIQRWAAQDQYKARLAAIHAGVVFWHVRMYTVNGFYEPTAVAFAALLLWALGAFTTKEGNPIDDDQDTVHRGGRGGRGRAASSSAEAAASVSPDYCDIILIDRPTDDELVQQFVRQGQNMHANITGVGNLFGPEGPRKVLAEGQKLLNNMKHWQGITNYWLRVLSRLENVTATVVNLGPGDSNNAGRASAPQVE